MDRTQGADVQLPAPLRHSPSDGFQKPAHIFHASLADDSVWVDDGNPSGMSTNGANTPGVIFDGAHYVIIAAQVDAGLWRYVEP